MGIALKKHAKLDTKFLKSCPIYWISLLFAKYFVQNCRLIKSSKRNIDQHSVRNSNCNSTSKGQCRSKRRVLGTVKHPWWSISTKILTAKNLTLPAKKHLHRFLTGSSTSLRLCSHSLFTLGIILNYVFYLELRVSRGAFRTLSKIYGEFLFLQNLSKHEHISPNVL